MYFRSYTVKNLSLQFNVVKPGRNTISRKSTESAITIPFEQTFRDLNDERPPESDPEGLDRFNFCGCGWPHHMLLPKGTENGYSMQLFIMVSNYEDDKVIRQNMSKFPFCVNKEFRQCIQYIIHKTSVIIIFHIRLIKKNPRGDARPVLRFAD